MTADAITYKQLDEVLCGLGFSRQRVEPRWLRYIHPESDTMIVLVEKKPNDYVRVTDALSARLHLVEKGLVGAEEIDAIFGRKAMPEGRGASKKG